MTQDVAVGNCGSKAMDIHMDGSQVEHGVINGIGVPRHDPLLHYGAVEDVDIA